jgi:hypothetical protein
MWHTWERRESVKGFGGKSKERDHRWEDGIRIDLTKIDWGFRVDSVDSGQVPVAGF